MSELAMLEAARDRAGHCQSDELAGLTAELRGVNEALWQVEDDLRQHELGRVWPAVHRAGARSTGSTIAELPQASRSTRCSARGSSKRSRTIDRVQLEIKSSSARLIAAR